MEKSLNTLFFQHWAVFMDINTHKNKKVHILEYS